MFDTAGPTPTPPSAPAPPPNPPMFGRDAYGTGAKKRNPNQGFAGTILGNMASMTLGNTAGKTLLGQ